MKCNLRKFTPFLIFFFVIYSFPIDPLEGKSIISGKENNVKTKESINYQENITEVKGKVRIIKEEAVLRLKPNKDSQVIKTLPIGITLDAIELFEEWVKVKLPPDKDGFVIIGYIDNSFLEYKNVRLKERDINIEDKTDTTFDYQGFTKNEDYYKWEERLNRVRAKESLGTGLLISGICILAPSLYFTLKKPEEGKYYKDWGKILIIIGDATGAVLFIFGMATLASTASIRQQLIEEGRLKGYITAGWLNEYNSIGIQITASF